MPEQPLVPSGGATTSAPGPFRPARVALLVVSLAVLALLATLLIGRSVFFGGITAETSNKVEQRLEGAVTAFLQGDRITGEKLLKEAAELAPAHPGVLLLRGRIKMETGDPAQAVALFNRIPDQETKYPERFLFKSVALKQLGDEANSTAAMTELCRRVPWHHNCPQPASPTHP